MQNPKELSSDSCFTKEEQGFLEHRITNLEGKTVKQQNPYKAKDLEAICMGNSKAWGMERL
jgi:hypothetical protein